MSMLRKTLLTTAIIGAGLASTTGAAFAGDHPSEGHESHASHDKSHEKSSQGDCLNAVDASNSNGSGNVLGGIITGGSQSIVPTNLCGNFSNNEFLSNNNVSLFGDVQNGDRTESSKTVERFESVDIAKTFG